MEKVLVLGASTNDTRYSYQAILLLRKKGHQVLAIGNKKGEINDVKINDIPFEIIDLDTITLYLSAKNQEAYYNYILELKPKRVIFNPGTENPKLYDLLSNNNIHFEVACTLVLLHTNQF